MRDRAALLRAHAYRMRGEPVPAPAVCAAPLITSVVRKGDAAVIAWRGVAGADKYGIEYSTSDPAGPWTAVPDRMTDNESPWADNPGPAAASMVYRVRAYNLAGVPGEYSAPAACSK